MGVKTFLGVEAIFCCNLGWAKISWIVQANQGSFIKTNNIFSKILSCWIRPIWIQRSLLRGNGPSTAYFQPFSKTKQKIWSIFKDFTEWLQNRVKIDNTKAYTYLPNHNF